MSTVEVWVTTVAVLAGWAAALKWVVSTFRRTWLRAVVAMPLAVIWGAVVLVAVTNYY